MDAGKKVLEKALWSTPWYPNLSELFQAPGNPPGWNPKGNVSVSVACRGSVTAPHACQLRTCKAELPTSALRSLRIWRYMTSESRKVRRWQGERRYHLLKWLSEASCPCSASSPVGRSHLPCARRDGSSHDVTSGGKAMILVPKHLVPHRSETATALPSPT